MFFLFVFSFSGLSFALQNELNTDIIAKLQAIEDIQGIQDVEEVKVSFLTALLDIMRESDERGLFVMPAKISVKLLREDINKVQELDCDIKYKKLRKKAIDYLEYQIETNNFFDSSKTNSVEKVGFSLEHIDVLNKKYKRYKEELSNFIDLDYSDDEY